MEGGGAEGTSRGEGGASARAAAEPRSACRARGRIFKQRAPAAPLLAAPRSALLASQVGSYHLDVSIDSIVASLLTLFTTVTGKMPRFRADGGSPPENLALQNIQVGG